MELKGQVLVPIDFSKESFEALSYAAGLIEDFSNLHVLYILPRLDHAEPGATWQELEDTLRQKSARDAFFEQFSRPEFRQMHLEVIIGDPLSEILNYAERKGIELIVLSCHGSRQPAQYLTEAIAEKIVQDAQSLVILLR